MNTQFSAGFDAACIGVNMIKPVMILRVAAVAFAASALFTAPALAETNSAALGKVDAKFGDDARIIVQVGEHGHYRRDDYRRGRGRQRLNAFGQSRWEERELRQEAAEVCRTEIDRVAWRIGFRDVDFDDGRYVEQVGPYRFIVHYEVEFEGRRRDYDRDVACTVRRGEVTDISGLPDARRYRVGYGYEDGYRRNFESRFGKYSEQNWQDYDRQHAGHAHARGEECAADGDLRGGRNLN
jgi:hypothetical protein